MKVACVGAGPAGLYLSILLKLHDSTHNVIVYERRQSGSVAGWGVTFGSTLLAHLYEQDRQSADRIREAALVWEDQVIYIHGVRVANPFGSSYNISRQRLLDILSDRAQQLGVNIVYGREILSPAELSDADLIVAADGAAGQLRQEAEGFGTRETWGRNKYIWLGASKVFGVFSFFFVPTPSGWIWAHAYGIDPRTSTFIVECTPETYAELGFDKLSTNEALPVLEELFSEYLAGHRLLGDLGDGTKARWLNFHTISNQHWRLGNVVLVGDSAHTTHFATGMGTTLALEDVIALADNLQQDANLETALLSYETQRQAAIKPVMTEARLSARWLEDISRYIDLKPSRFGTLFHARRSPMIVALPPWLSYLLLQAASHISIVDFIRARAAITANAISGHRNSRGTLSASVRRSL